MIFDREGDFMQQANAILKLNLTVLLKDKISLIWGLLLPTITLLFNMNNIQSSSVLVYWWVYIFFTAFIYGVGLYALSEKDSGILIFIYSIKWINFQFFLGCLLTQIVYGLICMILFNLLASILLSFNFIILCLYGLLSLIICIPLAFISYNFTYIKSLYSTSITSICNILVFSMFITIGFSNNLNHYNPLYKMAQIQLDILQGIIPSGSLAILILLALLSLPSIILFKPISIENR